jgi:hypothetical protein
MKTEHDALREQIHTAFPKEPIKSGGAFEQWGTTYTDAALYMKQIDGKSWDQLDREYIVRRSDALGFIGTDHLIAVLPVYLLALVEQGIWSPAAGMLTLILTKPLPRKDTGLGAARFNALVEALTTAQHIAVACTLRAFADEDPDGSLGQAARAALANYWNTYLPTGQ